MPESRAGARWKRIHEGFEQLVLAVLQFLLIVVIVLAVTSIVTILWTRAPMFLQEVQSVPELQDAVLRAFSGVLLVVLGLELLETLRVFRATHRVRLQIILVVGLIAVTRHVMVFDVEHVDYRQIAGAAILILALAVGYYLAALADSRLQKANDTS